jgi:4-hydroxythreonine-4-phosphate dehydrogenase
MSPPRIALTVGDPAGIGPEIVEKAVSDDRVRAPATPSLPGGFGDNRAAYEAIVRAVGDAQEGVVEAIATGPISKEALARAGLPWRGHTDLLAHLTGARSVAMMFYSDALRVVLATVHVPLGEVPASCRERLEAVIRLTAHELPRFGFSRPRLAVAGLNPHAGEHGIMGAEDDHVLAPTVERCRDAGIDVQGPVPADTLFVRASRGEFDAVIACYHDQGLIPVKLVAFGRAVNVTLGLPIVRTSVDHGTAFDIAGKGVADPRSMIEAVLLAAWLARTRAPRLPLALLDRGPRFPIGFPPLDRLAPVVRPLPLGQPDRELHTAVLEVHAERHECQAALDRLADQLPDLAGMKEQLAPPKRLVLRVAAVAVRADVDAVDEHCLRPPGRSCRAG